MNKLWLLAAPIIAALSVWLAIQLSEARMGMLLTALTVFSLLILFCLYKVTRDAK